MKIKKPFLLAALFLSTPIWAVIINGDDGLIHTTSPNPQQPQGWTHTARLGYSSSVYLANNWFISAYHVKHFDNPSSVQLDAGSYSIDANSWTRLSNPGSGSDTDLILFRATENVGLQAMSVNSRELTAADELTMIGFGKTRGAEYLKNGVRDGYYYTGSNAKQWGQNNFDLPIGTISDGYGQTDMFSTKFTNEDGKAHAGANDSGGGVFVQNGNDWDLAGIMLAISTSRDTNGTRIVDYGDRTYIADLSTYSAQISSIIGSIETIPEPSALLLCAISTIALLSLKRLFVR